MSDLIQRANDHAMGQLAELARWWLPRGRREGHEWKCGSLSGEPGGSLSVNLTSGVWKDFSTGESGQDPVSLWAAVGKMSMGDSARHILGEQKQDWKPTPGKGDRGKGDWVAQPHALPGAPAPTMKHHRYGAEPSRWWEYRTAEGLLAGYAIRYDLPDGGKDVVPMSWCQHTDGRVAWRWKAMAEPRPLYRLPQLLAEPEKTVVVVEGEKAAEALASKFPLLLVTTWAGGGSAARKTDFTQLKGRTVVLWPDRDRKVWEEKNAPIPSQVGQEKAWELQPGTIAMAKVANYLATLGCVVSIVVPPDDVCDGWDAYDCIADGNYDIPALLREAAPFSADLDSRAEQPPGPPMNPANPRRMGALPFTLLGCFEDKYYYLPDNGEQIVELTASGHTKNAFFQLASIDDWFEEFGIHWDSVASRLIQQSQALPKFDVRRVRGRGCWVDGKSVVFHAGDRLLVDGESSAISSYCSPTNAIYPSGLQIAVDEVEPLESSEANKLGNLCGLLAWDNPLYGTLLAGWLALSPICGALSWRPHLWITGAAGSGKSWVMNNIIAPVVGKSAINVQGNTTEAGLRGVLQSDALPVIFDESETENQKSQQRMDGVLELARQSSSESGAGIYKGTASGGSVCYLVRSMFLFSSIGVAAAKRADTSRISLLHLKGSDARKASQKRDMFPRIVAEARETVMMPDWCARLRARSIANAATTRANAVMFAEVAASFLGDQRAGDQMGALLAGAWSLEFDRLVSVDDARGWMARQNWEVFKSQSSDTDETACINHLMAAIVSVDGGSTRKSIQELVSMAFENLLPSIIRTEEEDLIRHGIRLDKKNYTMQIANNHPQLEAIFRDTAWSGQKWKNQLKRLSGAIELNTVRFGSFIKTRCVSVPLPEDIANAA